MRLPWPGQRALETELAELRADSSYTNALVAAISANAGGLTSAYPTSTGALEAAAGFVGKAFAAAEITASDAIVAALDPPTMAMIGRALIRRGEIVMLIRVDAERGLTLLPCQSHDVAGSPDPTTWTYRCSVGGPERTLTYAGVPAEGVIHLRYATDPERPWRGYGPLGVALLAGRLSAETVSALADEVSGPRGTLLGVPVDGNDPTVEKLRTDIAGLKGRTALWQGGSDWDNEGTGGKAGMGTVRLGANPPASLVELHKRATQEVYAACGLNPSIFESGTGTQARESYRQALFGTIAPLGRIVETELRNKLNDPGITIEWSELRAADIASRARAFQSMVGGGMDLAQAAALSGLMVQDDAA